MKIEAEAGVTWPQTKATWTQWKLEAERESHSHNAVLLIVLRGRTALPTL